MVDFILTVEFYGDAHVVKAVLLLYTRSMRWEGRDWFRSVL